MIEKIIGERAVGTEANNRIIDLVDETLSNLGYSIEKLPFNCLVWKYNESWINIGNKKWRVEPNPFSEPFEGRGKLVLVGSVSELEKVNDCCGSILLLVDELTKNPLQPKNFPFYYPEEHKKIITLLEEKQPVAILAVTGKNLMSGCDPFPFFEDGDFLIPSASIGLDSLEDIKKLTNLEVIVDLKIDSRKLKSKSCQIVASKKVPNSKGKIVIAAHMDTKYNTPGALDNAAGLAVLLKTAEIIKTENFDVEVVPFNSEEYFGANGELKYLDLIKQNQEKIALMINIDSPCHLGSKMAVSFYNFNERMTKLAGDFLQNHPEVIEGDQWYAGDHSAFVFQDVPCVAITSSDLFDGALEFTHTPKDTLDSVDTKMIEHVAKNIASIAADIKL